MWLFLSSLKRLSFVGCIPFIVFAIQDAQRILRLTHSTGMIHTPNYVYYSVFKGHIKKGLFFYVFVFFLHLWCYVCRSAIQHWGKINTAHYLVSWTFTLVKALVLQKRKLVVNGPSQMFEYDVIIRTYLHTLLLVVVERPYRKSSQRRKRNGSNIKPNFYVN